MSTETGEIKEVAIVPQIVKEVAEAKRSAWGILGVKIYEEDINFQLTAQGSIAKLVIPKTIEEVANAEKILKLVKSEAVALKQQRTSLTNPIKNKISELMAPEQSFDGPCKEVETAIISLKKVERDRQNAESLRIRAAQSVRESLTMLRNSTDLKFKNLILDQIGKVYSHALGKGNIELDMVDPYIDFALKKGSLGPTSFDFEFPKNTNQNITEEKYQELCMEILVFDGKIYMNDYENQLKEKFSDFAVAIQNKDQALKLAAEEEKKKKAEAESQKKNSDVAEKLNTAAVASEPVISTGGKQLKKSYETDMPETIESVICIMTAFTANIDLCMPKLNVSKWFSFTPKQAATALSKVKTDDPTFDHPGLVWKEVDKL